MTRFRVGMCAYIALVHLAAVCGVACLWTHPDSLWFACEMLLWYQITALGVTVGCHRLWSHRSYQAAFPTRAVLMVLASMANQGTIFHWCRDHRLHHKHSDTAADPHDASRGFFFSHMGWLLLKKDPQVVEAGVKIAVNDLLQDPVVWLNWKLNPWWNQFWCFVVPGLYGTTRYGSFRDGLLVLGALRYVILLHATWCVNSVAHLCGERPYKPELRAFENWFTALVAVGEGWHNWHHAYPYDYAAAQDGIMLQWNPSKAFIDTMAWCGQVSHRKRRQYKGSTALPPRRSNLMESLGVTILERCAGVSLTVQTSNGSEYGSGGRWKLTVPHVWSLLCTLARRGEIGFGEAYAANEWSLDNGDLGDFMTELAAKGGNESWFDVVKQWWPGEWLRKRRHTYRSLDHGTAKELIKVAYDVSDDLFTTMLDQSMTYTCGRWSNGAETLGAAQRHKRQALIDKACLPPDSTVLDIGCGWGGLVQHVADDHPTAAVFGITNSPSMAAKAKDRTQNAVGVQIFETDYRQTAFEDETFDAIFSVEMLEAIGVNQFPDFAGVCARLLKPGGKAVIQVITAPAWSNPTARSKTKHNETFVTTYIFPGGQIPHVEHLHEAMAPYFHCRHTESFGHDYVRTLQEWRANLGNGDPDVPEATKRCYDYYLAWCEAGFASELLSVHQIVYERHQS